MRLDKLYKRVKFKLRITTVACSLGRILHFTCLKFVTEYFHTMVDKDSYLPPVLRLCNREERYIAPA